MPNDTLIQLTLGSLLVEVGDAAAALELLLQADRTYRTAEIASALAACTLALGDEVRCAEALERALRSSFVETTLSALADRVVERFGLNGWCGIGSGGRVRTGERRPRRVLLDGVPVSGLRLPSNWQRGNSVEVEGAKGPFLGSKLSIAALCRVDGFVDMREGGILGWAYRVADPDRPPHLVIRGTRGSIGLRPLDPADGVEDLPPMTRPRQFFVSAEQAAALGAPIAITDELGRHLLGSPVVSILAAQPRLATPAVNLGSREVDVVIPVYRGHFETLACIRSVLLTLPKASVVHIVDDASPEEGLVAALQELDNVGEVRLYRVAVNRGFPAAANLGILAAAGRDVVLLNSDTMVPEGWLERLRRAAYSASDIGTATPFSNDATILSYPSPAGGNPQPGSAEQLDRIARAANSGLTAEIPVGVGFCLFIRRDCLDQIGPLREDVFAQGYGEETEFCLRASQAGWRHTAALDVFVAHRGRASFGSSATHLRRRNDTLLSLLHSGFAKRIEDHCDSDPLLAARRRMDALRWAEQRQPEGAVLLVTHNAGGGVAEFVRSRQDLIGAHGGRPVVLRPAKGGCVIDGYPNLRFALPSELAELGALLRPDCPVRMEVHHLLGHDHGVLDLAHYLKIPVEFWVHDDALFCPQIALVGPAGRYCGEPAIEECEHCVSALGNKLEEAIGIADLRARSGEELAAANQIIVPTHDGARRLQRHFPAVRARVSALEDDGAWPELVQSSIGPVTKICVVGAVGVEKGYEILLSCARDAQRRGLSLEFALCGYAPDEEALLESGVFVTGRYDPGEAVALIRAQAANLAFLPSIWPETWCFALSRVWQAGLFAVAFDLGAQAERIRATGRGALLPLALPPARINDVLLRLATAQRAWHRSQP